MGSRDRFAGQVVVVVGATSGIGRATTLALAERGADLVLAARSRAPLDELVTRVEAQGARALAVPTDVVDADAVDRLADAAVATFGRIDGWVQAAAVMVAGDLASVPQAELEHVVDVNVDGTMNAARSALRVFRDQGSGSLVLVSSLLGRFPNPLAPVYVATKFAVRGLALSLQQALRHERDIHVSVVMPGPVDTPMFARAADRTGGRLRAIPPAQAPARAAAMVLRTLRRPSRERTSGAGNRTAVLAHRVAPRLTEELVGRWSAGLLVGPEPQRSGPGAVFAISDTGRVQGGYRRGALRRRVGDAVGALLAGRGPGSTLDPLG